MEVRIQAEDKKAAFTQLIEDILFAFRITKDKEDIKRLYIEALLDMYSLLDYDEMLEIKKKILFNFDWMPKIKEMKDFANKYVKEKSKLPKEVPIKLENFKHSEVSLSEAKEMFINILKPFFKEESIKNVFDSLDLRFRGYSKEDWELFADKLMTASGNITSQRILDFFGWMLENRVEPRLRDARKSGVKLWQDEMPNPEIRAKYKEIMNKLWNGQVLELEKK